MRPVRDDVELERAFAAPWAVVFKHSTRCPVSSVAWREVARFREAHPASSVFVVHVVEQRALSNAIAARTGVRHESPQAIVLSNGVVQWAGSHEQVTLEALEALLPVAVGH